MRRLAAGIERQSLLRDRLSARRHPARGQGFRSQNALENGATELDMVDQYWCAQSTRFRTWSPGISGGWSTTGHAAGALVKVIIETCLLNDEEKVLGCLLAKEAGADFVKTSTGFSTGGATVEDIACSCARRSAPKWASRPPVVFAPARMRRRWSKPGQPALAPAPGSRSSGAQCRSKPACAPQLPREKLIEGRSNHADRPSSWHNRFDHQR